jgi:NADPH:quinone reductase-like Zn-dependent oxidoreductase
MIKAAVLHGTGQAPRYEDFSEPTAGEGEVVVEVLAAAIKNLDRMMAAGRHYDAAQAVFPRVVGQDGVGVLPDGTRVITTSARGMMGEKAAVIRRRCIPISREVEPALAAALFNPGMSAWISVHWRGDVKPGQNLLVLGATGTTGKLAVQLARRRGVGRIVAAGRDPKALEELLGLGADAVLSLAEEEAEFQRALKRELAEHPVDVVFDYLWGRPAELVLGALGGHDLEAEPRKVRYVEIGEMAGSHVSMPGGLLRSQDIEIVGQGGGGVPREVLARLGEAVPWMLDLASKGELRIDYETVPLRDVEAAWGRAGERTRRIVVVP